MDNIGGAEKVGLTLAKELKADFYSTLVDKEKIKKMGFKNINVKSIGRIPINAPFKQQLALYKFRKLNLKELHLKNIAGFMMSFIKGKGTTQMKLQIMIYSLLHFTIKPSLILL